MERLSIDEDGLVVHELKRPFRDGTTQILFEPLDFIARLAALIPRPRTHQVRYHGIFAPNAHRRRLVVPSPAALSSPTTAEETEAPRPCIPMSWMQRLRRVFDIDLSECPRCGGALRVLSVITDPTVIRTILEHLDNRAARAPPAAA